MIHRIYEERTVRKPYRMVGYANTGLSGTDYINKKIRYTSKFKIVQGDR